MALRAMVLKEVQERAPTRRAALMRSAYVLALYGAGLLVFASSRDTASGATGREIFVYLAYFQFFLAASLSPALTANAITSEKTAGTLGILFLSQIRSSDIVIGKLLPRLVDLATAILASLPLVLVFLLFGGVSTEEYVQVYLVMTAVALFGASAGIFFSVILRNGGAAIILSYAATALYLFFPKALPQFGSLLYLSPVYTLERLLDPNAIGGSAGVRIAFIPLGFAAAMAVAFVSLSVLCLQRFAEADLGGMIRTLFERMDPFIERLLPQKGIFFESEERKYLNPFTWRELNAKPLAKFRYLFIMMLGYAIVLLLCDLFFLTELTTAPKGAGTAASGFHETYLFVQIGFLVLIATVLGAGTITAEKESHALDILLTTPMFPQSYVNGKFLGLFWGCMLFLVPLAAHVLLFAAVRSLPWVVALSVIVFTPAILACNIAHALYVSLYATSTVKAVMLSILLNSVVLFAVLSPECCILVPIDPIPILWMVLFTHADKVQDMSASGAAGFLMVVVGVPIFAFIIFCANAFYVTAVLGNMVDNFQKRARRHLE